MEEMIKKLPYIMSALMALISGILGFINDKSQNNIYTSMIISIVVFGLIGKLAKEFILKNKPEEIIPSEEVDIEESEEMIDTRGSTIDFKVDDSDNPVINNFYGEDFSPLKVSKVIKTGLEDNK